MKVRKRSLFAPIIILSVIVSAGFTLHYYLLDGLDGWFISTVLSPAVPQDTEYAAGYSDRAFRRVRVGMAASEVLALLGPPLDKRPLEGGRETWRWSRSPGSKSYRVRVAVFEGDRVVKVLSSFYPD